MAKRMRFSRLLDELEAGRTSTEEALEAARSGERAVTSLLDRIARRQKRRPTVRRIKQLPHAVIASAVARVKRHVGRRRDVTSVHWGVRRVRGRRTNESAVVVHVKKKLPPRVLRSLQRRGMARTVRVQHRRRRYVVRIDVQAVKVPAILHTSFLMPGDHGGIRVGGEHIGALGAIAPGGTGLFALTAGHVAAVIGSKPAECVDDEAGAFPLGRVRVNAFSRGIDIAAIGPVASVPPGAVLDATIVRDPVESDTHERVSIFVPGMFTPIESHIDDVGVTRTFSTAAGVITMSGLTATARVTDPGDSGAPALDQRGALIGFVIGGDSDHTYLLPARRALDALDDLL